VIRQWVGACALAETIGMTAAALASRAAAERLDGRPVGGLLLVVLGGLVEGTALGVLQAAALPHSVGAALRRRWAWVTVVVAGLGWGAASAPSALDAGGSETAPPWPLVVLGAAALGGLMGAVLGAAQAAAVRRTAPNPRRWVVASAVGWTCAMPVVFAGATSAGADWSWWAVALLGAGTGLVAGTVLGLATRPFLGAVATPAQGTLVPPIRAL
jgi:hypothetical protein